MKRTDVMNRRERRALAAQGLLPDIDETLSEVSDLPIFHIAISRNKGSEVILALSPRRWRDMQAAFAIEFANGLRIQDQLIALANHLQIPDALKFEFENNVLEVLGGTIMQVLRGHSSKEVAQVFEDVIKDPGKATARVNESRLHDLVIRTLSEQVSIDAADPIAKLTGLEQLQRAARKAQAAFGESPPGRGRPREVHKSNFFEGVVAIAKAFRGNLGLPQHGRDEAATPLFLFGDAMLDLLVCHGTAFALESGLDANRFAIFQRLNRAGLIVALERARTVVLAEKPMISKTPQK
jgi:hypothetical protein